MLKLYIIIVFLFLTSGCATNMGYFVDRSAYTKQPHVIGKGSTEKSAITSAFNAIPKDYELDKVNYGGSGIHSCENYDKSFYNKKLVCISENKNSSYVYHRAVAPKDEEKLKKLREYQKSLIRNQKYIHGIGDNLTQAKKNLIKNIPSGYSLYTVNDGFSIGCTGKIYQKYKSYEERCDLSDPSNQVKVGIGVYKINRTNLDY